jgi:hypothetical protein
MNIFGPYRKRAATSFCSIIIIISIGFACSGCGTETKNAQMKGTQLAQTQSVPTRFRFVEAKAVTDRHALRAQVIGMFNAKNYDGLEKLASELRQKKGIYPAGRWHLDYYYEFLSVSQRDPDPEWERHLSQLEDWVKARPNSITARLALANTMAEYGWKGRSSAWASNVTEQQWKLFRERLAKAHKLLMDADKLKKKCPCWYGMMLNLGLGENLDRKEYDRLFNESVKREPAYLSVYMDKLTYLQPRWHGEPGEWQKFAQESADKIGGAEGDKVYARMIWNIEWLAGEEYASDFHSGRLSWDRAKRGFHGLMAEYADDWGPPSEFCTLSVMAGDRQQAKELFEKLGDRVMLVIWKSPEKFKQSRDWAFGGG